MYVYTVHINTYHICFYTSSLPPHTQYFSLPKWNILHHEGRGFCPSVFSVGRPVPSTQQELKHVNEDVNLNIVNNFPMDYTNFRNL